MPRCQQSFRRLPPASPDAERGGRLRWVCPFCVEGEVYEAVRDPDLLQYAALADAACCRDFGKPSDHKRLALLLWGIKPECVLEPGEKRYDIYLQSGSDPWQARLQIGHEIFHRVCSGGRVFHWTHEMLACLFSVRLLRQSGGAVYAAQEDARYREEALLFSLSEAQSLDLFSCREYPPGFYGRVYVTGEALCALAGWPALCRLARCLTAENIPDTARWLGFLPPDVARQAQALLTPPLPGSSVSLLPLPK